MPLNDTALMVLTTKTMRFTEKEALAYLKAKNHEISIATYYRILAKIDTDTRKRLYDICKNFTAHHMERIESLREIEKQLWQNYHLKKPIVITTREDGYDENNKKYSKTGSEIIEIPQSPIEKAKILKDLTELQPYISAYEEATQSIMERSMKQFGKEEDVDLSSIGL